MGGLEEQISGFTIARDLFTRINRAIHGEQKGQFHWLIGIDTLHISDIGREKVFCFTCQVNCLRIIIWILFSSLFSPRARTDIPFAMFRLREARNKGFYARAQ